MRKILMVLALVPMLAVWPVNAEPLMRVHTSYYYIDGPSATVLMAQVDKSGPLGADGKHHAGRTRWDIQWKLRSEQQGSACTIKDVAVALGIAQTFPKWRGEDKSAPGLKAGWSKFKAALQRHEDAHKQHGIQAAKDIEAGIRAVKSASNCEAVEAAANAQAHAIITKYQALDETYDRDTDYGHSEGVTLF